MREWIVTNGLGSYASLTHSNDNIRKFNGLLVASLNPPTKRWMFVTNIYDTITTNGKIYDLNNQKGRFTFDIYPSFFYNINEVSLKKTIFMEYQKNTTIIKYEIKTNSPILIIHKPIINSRHFYDITEKNSIFFHQNLFKHGVSINPNNTDRTIKIIIKNSSYELIENWLEYRYQKDFERKDSWFDNCIHAGNFYKPINSSCEYYVICTIENDIYDDPKDIFLSNIKRKKKLIEKTNLPYKFEKLILASDNFVVKKGDSKSIVAGYHWFGDWGRDTMISLPGITLITKRFEDAKKILINFGKYCKHGLIPNAFIDRESNAIYNTVDASLWYIDRVYQYLKYTYDLKFIEDIWDILNKIIDCYRTGTDYNIHMDEDHLMYHGTGLTWMDVKIADFYPTPRTGKAVEIQALWYNALKIMGNLAELLNKKDIFSELADKVKKSFIVQFDQYYDIIDTKDLSRRPNKIFLVSLDFSMLEKNHSEQIVNDIQKELLTLFGLRTLSSKDPRYLGVYIGNHNKDIAYHNGIVWPWLLGPFIKAFVKIKNYDEHWRSYAFHNFLKPMLDVYGVNWDGSIHEIYDGNPPYYPHGCITQAWSVGEILRSWVEDIEHISPKFEHIISNKISI
jgi:predicted glycogen debranching enzyme